MDDIAEWKRSHKEFYPIENTQNNVSAGEVALTPRFSSLDTTSNAPMSESKCKPRYVTRDEIAKHNACIDLWAIFDGRAYDVTSYSLRHPEVACCFLNNIGKDSTACLFKKFPNCCPSLFFKDELIGKVVNEN